MSTHLKTPVHKILNCLFADDGIVRVKHLGLRGKVHYLGKNAQKSKAAHPVNYFPGFLGKNIKNGLPSKLSLFTSLALSQNYQHLFEK